MRFPANKLSKRFPSHVHRVSATRNATPRREGFTYLEGAARSPANDRLRGSPVPRAAREAGVASGGILNRDVPARRKPLRPVPGGLRNSERPKRIRTAGGDASGRPKLLRPLSEPPGPEFNGIAGEPGAGIGLPGAVKTTDNSGAGLADRSEADFQSNVLSSNGDISDPKDIRKGKPISAAANHRDRQKGDDGLSKIIASAPNDLTATEIEQILQAKRAALLVSNFKPGTPDFRRAQQLSADLFIELNDQEKRALVAELVNQNPALNRIMSDPLGFGRIEKSSTAFDLVENSLIGFGPKVIGDQFAAIGALFGRTPVNPFSNRLLSSREVLNEQFATLGIFIGPAARPTKPQSYRDALKEALRAAGLGNRTKGKSRAFNPPVVVLRPPVDRNKVFFDTDDLRSQHLNEQIGKLVEAVASGPKSEKQTIFYDVIAPAQVRELSPLLKQHLQPNHLFDTAIRVMDADSIRHILREHSRDLIPLKPADFRRIPEVLRNGELVEVGRHKKGEVMILRRQLIDGNWLYVGETIRGSLITKEPIARPTLALKTAYWSPAPKN